MDRKLLLCLIEKFEGGPVGVDSLAAAIGEERGTIEDVIEFLLSGASLVQIGTMNYQNPNLGPQLKDELFQYLNDKGIEDISNLIGKVEYYSD